MPIASHPIPAPPRPLAPAFASAPSNDATHARLVSALVHLLFALGFRNIHTVTRTSGDTPHRPDVIARSGHDTRSLFAVETAASLQSEQASRRLLTLAAEADGDDLWVAVPSDVRADALHRVDALQIPARVIGV